MLVGGTQTYGRFRCMGADGTERWLEGSISPVMDRQNTALKFLLMAADVTASHKSLAAADEQRKTLETEQAQVVYRAERWPEVSQRRQPCGPAGGSVCAAIWTNCGAILTVPFRA